MAKKLLQILSVEDKDKLKKKDEAKETEKNVTASDVAKKFNVQLTTNDTGSKTTPGVNPVNQIVNATKQKVDALYQNRLTDIYSRAKAYAEQGPEYVLDLANSIVGGNLTSPGSGNTGKLDIDAIYGMTKMNSEISRMLSESGIFNIREIATNPYYAHLSSQDYRKSLLPILQNELTGSQKADEDNKAAVAEYEANLRNLRAEYERQAETAAQWKNFFSPLGENPTLDDKLRAAGIATGQTYDMSVFRGMDKYTAYEKKQELDNWFAGLDAAALSATPVVEEPEAPKYTSKTAGIQDEISTLEKYLNAHQTLEELTAYARSNPNFAADSVYTAPDYSNLSAWEQFLAPQMGGAYSGNALATYINTGDVDPYFSQDPGSADYYKRWEELGYNYMLDKDKAIWNVLQKMDPAKASEYLHALSQIYLLPTRAQGYRSWDETVATNPWTAAPAWIGSVGRGIDNILNVPRQLAEAWAGIDNAYSAAFDSLNRQGYTRNAQLGAIQESDMPDWLKTVASYGYQGASSFADNTARLIASGFNPTTSLIMAGMQSASASLHESSSRDDMSGAAKIIKAIGAGAMEVGTEKIGLDALFDKGKKGALQYLKNVVLSEISEETINAASEPMLEAVVAYLFDHEAEIKSGPEFWSDLTDTAITTAISSLLSGGGGVITQRNETARSGEYTRQNGDPERILQIATGMAEGTESKRVADEVTARLKKNPKKGITNYELGKLTQSLGNDLGQERAQVFDRVQDEAIENRLIELGDSPETAKKNAPAIRKLARGEKLTIKERAVDWNENMNQVVRELTRETEVEDADRVGNSWVTEMGNKQRNETASVRAKMAEYGMAMREPSIGQAATRAEEAAQAKVQKKGGKFTGKPTDTHVTFTRRGDAEPGSGDLHRFEKGNDGKMYAIVSTGDSRGKMPGVVSTGDSRGKMPDVNDTEADTKVNTGLAPVGKLPTVNDTEADSKMDTGLAPVANLREGEVAIPVEDIDIAAGEGIQEIIEFVMDDTLPHEVTAEEANALMQSYKASGGGKATTFIEAFEGGYLRGFSGQQDVGGVIDPAMSKVAYEAGKADAEKYEATRVERAKAARKVTNPTVGWIGDIEGNASISGKGDSAALDAEVENMTEGQRLTVEYGKALAKRAGINVVFYRSKAGADGKITTDNGRYVPSTHTIYLDINAGVNDATSLGKANVEGTLGYAMSRTLGHEVTHAIEATSAEFYAKYKQAVKEALNKKGKDWAVLVRDRIDQALSDGKKMTYAEAESEVVADASEYMLQDAKITQELEPGLYNKIKAVVKDFVTKLNDVFRELGLKGSVESRTLREMRDGVYHYMDGLQELWGAAFDEMAGIEGTAAVDGVEDALYKTGEVYDYTAQSSARVNDKETIEFLENQQHITTYRAMQMIDGELYPPMAEFIGSKKDGNREDASAVGSWEMATEHPELIKWVDGKPKFELKKVNDDGSVSTVPAAYNPYMHSSNTVLNDQFSKAFQRKNLVVVECVVPVSESDGAYHAQYAKDATGWHEWKSGIVAGELAKQKSGFRRDVFLSRYIKPVRILSDAEVAEKIAGYLDGTDVTIPFQSAWPTLRDALVQAGVNVTEPRGLGPSQMKIAMEAFNDWKSNGSEDYYQSNARKNNSFDRAVEVRYNHPSLKEALTRDEALQLDDRLHYRIHFPSKGNEIKIGSDFAEEITAHGDHMRLVVMRRDTRFGISVLGVYNVNPKRYNGRIPDLIPKYKEAIKKHGAEWFERCYRLASWDGRERFFSGWDRENLVFPAFEKVEQRDVYDETNGTTDTSGIRGNRAGDAGRGEVTSPDGIDIDKDADAAYFQPSARTWYESDYVTKRDEAAEHLAKTIGVPVSKARKWIDDVTSVAAYVLDNKARVDYIPTAVKGISAFKSNPEYGGSIDMSTICAKRRLATGTLDAIQRVLGDEVLTKDDFLRIREMMKERGHEVACGLCFVESSRKNLSKYNAQFMEQYNSTHPDGEISMTDLNTVDGLENLRVNNEDAYSEYEKFMNKLAQRKPKLFEKRTEYEHEILKRFKSDTTVGVKNRNGGLRLQSFSDFEIVHLIDMMQVITDMASVGLAGQAYTKVPDFAWALGNTGLKINLSLIAKGVDADGNLIFDDVEGMPYKEAKKLRDYYSENVGTVVVTFTDEQLIAAMKSNFVDYIIPFHRSQWQKSDYKQLGLPEGTKDYTLHQNEKQGRKRVKENFLPNAYWDPDLSGNENAEVYLKMCEADGRTPKFAKFLSKDADGHWVAPDGYWKLLIDFKMYDNNGKGSRQMPVQPNFNMDKAMEMLENYKGTHDSFPVAQDVVDDFVQEYRDSKGGVQKTGGQYTVNPYQSSARTGLPEEIGTREYLSESDDSIAETVEERNALTIYQQRLKAHAEASEAVMAAEDALIGKEGQELADARAELAKARSRQNELYRRLLKVENTEHVQKVIERTQRFINEELHGKTSKDVAQMVSGMETEIANLKSDLEGLKGAAKTQREADIRQRERMIARLRSQSAQALIRNTEEYQNRIKALREHSEISKDIAKKERHIKHVVKNLSDRILMETDYNNVKEPLKPAVHALVKAFVDDFGNLVFTNPSDEAVGRGKESTLKAREKFERLKMAYDKLADIDGEEAMAYDPEVSAWLAELHTLAESYDTLADITDSKARLKTKLYIYERLSGIADSIAYMVKTADQIFVNGRRQQIANVAGDVANTLTAKNDRKEFTGKLGEAINALDDVLLKGNMTAVTFFESLENSGLKHLYDDITDAERVSAARVKEARDYIAELMKKHGYLSWGNMRKPVSFVTEQGREVYMTTGNMLWAYATAKRELSNPLTATHHLSEGGFAYDEKAKRTKEVNGSQWKNTHNKLSAKDIVTIEGMLTADQKAFADACVEYMSTECADWGNEASMALFGIKKYNEEYYFPYQVDKDQLHKNSAAGSASTTDDARLKHISFSHSVTANANEPLVMGDFLDIVDNHINQMAIYSAFVLPIENLNRVLNSKVEYQDETVTIRSLIASKHGKAAQKYLTDFLKDMNGGPQTDKRGEANGFIRLFKKNAVMGKLSVAMQQFSSIARAFVYINPKYFLNIPKELPYTTWERMMQYSGTTVYKDMGGFNVGLGKQAADWIGKGALEEYNYWERGKFLLDQKGVTAMKDNWVDFLTALPGVMDKITWAAIWTATENEQADLHPGMDRNSVEFLEMVGERFDDVVRHSQVYDSVLAKSQNMRSKSGLAKMATAFMAEPTLTMNMLYSAFKNGDKKLIARTAVSLVLNAVLGALGYAAVTAWDKDDDERTATEKFVTKFSGKLVDSINPLTMIPIVSDMWSIVSGYDVERTDMAVFADLYKYGKQFFEKLDEGKEITFRDYENFFGTAVTTATGVPLKNLMGDFRRLVLNLPETDFSAPEASRVKYGVLDEIMPFRDTSNTSYYERLLAATMDGDKQEMHDLKDYLMATKSVKEDTVRNGVVNAYKKEYQRGGITKDEAVDFLEKNGLAKDRKSAFEYVDKWDEGTDGYSAYNTLRQAFSGGNSTEIQKAWKELEQNGWETDTIGNYVRGTIIKDMVTNGQITPSKATELIRKYYPYKKDSDNINKPQEWLKDK